MAISKFSLEGKPTVGTQGTEKGSVSMGFSPQFLKPNQVRVPSTDEEAMALISQAKSAWDWNDADDPGKHAQTKAVISAIEQYAENVNSPLSQKIVSAMRADPKLKPYL